MSQTILSGPDLTQGLLATFTDAYLRSTQASPQLAKFMDLGLPTSGRYEIYSYPETAPYMSRWKYGDPIPEEGTKYVQFSVSNIRFGKRIKWSVDDRLDGKTKSLFDTAQMVGSHAGMIPDDVFVEFLTGTTALMDSIPNDPTGVTLFYATDATGGARFGATGGNIVSGAGVASGDAVRSDFWKAYGRFSQFKDTKGKPYFNGNELSEMAICYAPENAQVFLEAFKQNITGLIVAGSAGAHVGSGTAVAAAGVSNTIQGAGLDITLWANPRLSGTNDWFVSAPRAPKKAIFEQRREMLTGQYATKDNSDSNRNYDEEYLDHKARSGFGCFLPLSLIKVDN